MPLSLAIDPSKVMEFPPFAAFTGKLKIVDKYVLVVINRLGTRAKIYRGRTSKGGFEEPKCRERQAAIRRLLRTLHHDSMITQGPIGWTEDQLQINIS